MAGFSAPLNKGLDFIGNVRNDLHGLAKVLAATLFTDDRFINLAGRKVITLAHLGRHESFVMAQIQIGLGTVFRDKDFAVLKGAHGARINVNVGIEF